MCRIRISGVVLLVMLLSLSLSAQTDYLLIKDKKITYKIRKDLLFVESDQNLKKNITTSFAKSVVFDGGRFIVAEIDTLEKNSEEIAKRSDVKNVANILESENGVLHVPTNKIFIKPKPEISAKAVLDELKKSGLQVVSSEPLYKNKNVLPESQRILVVELKAELNNILGIVNDLWKNPKFEFVEPNFGVFVNSSSHPSTNPYFSQQWGLQNVGQSGWTSGIDIKAIDAWAYTRGANVKVAVLDDGVELDHPDLSANILTSLGYDGTELASIDIPPGNPQLSDAHGTGCAGIVAAVDNDIGVIGVAPQASIVPVRVGYGITPGSTMWYMDHQKAANGINHAWQNADILSCSWYTVWSLVINDAFNNALILGRNGKGCIVVAIAGNNNEPSLTYPTASNPNIIAVGAMSPCGERVSPHSCDGEGWGSNYGDMLDIVAPGVKIPTTNVNGIYRPDFNGTSAATPHVAGVAALILSINPDLTRAQVTDIIESTAQKVGTYSYTYTPERSNGTWNNEMGYGLVDAYASVQAAMQTLPSVSGDTVTYNLAGTDTSVIDTISITPTGVTVIIQNSDYLHGAMISVRNMGLNDSTIVEWYGCTDQNNSDCADHSVDVFGNGAQINNFVSPKREDGSVLVSIRSATSNAYTAEIKIYNWMNGQGCQVVNSNALLKKSKDDMFGFAPIAVQEWPCGADGFDLTCVKDEEGTLTVYGVGRMRDYVPPMGGALIAASADASPAPWGGTAKIVIGNGVTYIGRFAFYVLNVQQPLTSVNVDAENPPKVGDSAFFTGAYHYIPLFVPQAKISAYRTADVWKNFDYINPSTVTFNPGEGSAVTPQFLSYEEKATKPDDPTRAGYAFGGWYKEEAYTNTWDFEEDKVTSDVTLFAKWTSTTAVAAPSRVSPQPKTGEEAAVSVPSAAQTAGLTAGPNPAAKASGGIAFFRQGKLLVGASLSVYDASGNIVKKLSIRDNAVGTQSKRRVGSWDLTDNRGRLVPEGSYLVKGTVKTSGGRSERVSLTVGVR